MISRDELYELVWSKPMTKVAEQFEVSNSYMARVCASLNVPRPERGYWAKLAVGKAPSREDLPEARPGDQLSWSKGGELSTPEKPRPHHRSLKAPLASLESRLAKSGTHALVQSAREHFENGRPVEDGAYLKPYKKVLLDVTTSNACLSKILGFANNLFNSLEAAGHRVVLAPSDQRFSRPRIDERQDTGKQRNHYQNSLWSPGRPTLVYVGTVPIGLAILEVSEEVLMRYIGNSKYIREADYVPPKASRYARDFTWTTNKEIPSGRLRLIAYSPYHRVSWSSRWDETANSTLEETLPAVVKAIESAAVELATKLEEADRRAEIAHQEWLAAQERRAKEEDRHQVEKSFRESRERLIETIQQWSQVIGVEQFLRGVEERASVLIDEERSHVLKRLTLARDFLGSQDPLDFFLAWKTPTELYKPKYDGPEDTSQL